MSNSRDERYYASVGRTGKSPSVGDQGSGFFHTGQGGRTITLPPISALPISPFPASSPYPNQYAQPRSIPTRYEYNSNALYNQWPSSNQSSSPMNYGYYDAPDTNRYASPPNYYSTYSSSNRASPTAPEHGVDSRKLPPLNTFSSPGRDERWSSNAPSYSVGPVDVPSNSGIRSPHPSYPDSYPAYSSTSTASNYGYSMPMTDPSQLQTVNNAQMAVSDSHRSTSPSSSYASGPSRVPSYTPPPISPTTSVNEPKKKRKRADPNQLKVLNETYARTAFPSTDERQALAKALDMSARSVQIWFQNKRQSMRQTRQSSSSGGALHQSYNVSTHGDSLADDHGHSAYEATSMQMPSSSYLPRSSHTSHTSPTVSPSVPHRRPRNQDAVAVDTKPQQWPPRY